MEFFYYFLIFLFGLSIGSFVNAWIWRMKNKLTLGGRSMCVSCKQTLLAKDLIPIFSFLFLRGKCRFCQNKISIKYPIVEFWFGISFLFVAIFHNFTVKLINAELIRDWFIILILSFLFIYDLLYRELPDKITLPAITLLFVCSLIFKWNLAGNMLIGASVTGGFFLLQYIISGGRWIGGGDIRLGFLMGIILGWPMSAMALMLAYILGAFISLILLLYQKTNLTAETPFGTYLCLSTFIIMFWGNDLLEWYLSLM